MAKVRAVKQGFVNGSRIREGVVFDWPDGKKRPSWVVDESAPKVEKPPVIGDTKPVATQKVVKTKAPEALV
jgi:hypothetical protein